MVKPSWAWLAALFCAAAFALMLVPALARDLGQWEQQDPEVSAWFRELKQPDTGYSCCGFADAYYADVLEVGKDGNVYATITDDRDDTPLMRPHIEAGTKFVVPPNKLVIRRSNPTGHRVIFINNGNVLCFVDGAGI